jgi:hypothetical protein
MAPKSLNRFVVGRIRAFTVSIARTQLSRRDAQCAELFVSVSFPRHRVEERLVSDAGARLTQPRIQYPCAQTGRLRQGRYNGRTTLAPSATEDGGTSTPPGIRGSRKRK